ncbi:hypothetical protein LOK49_LG13G00128 [Camellia lanceoleosa]|uniref:Uncharacterized protein n=1 Tax=Camellia lanceoleosa TaxID=1840588 RepID=A0ACC0FLF7_9ERIC|nr:hypothetical protein LOK49_LG13G00128 [Camellia lanceoleosa]
MPRYSADHQIRRKGPITAPVNFGNLVVMGIPRGAFRRIMEDSLEQSNEGGIEFNVSFEKASRFSYRDDETGERELYYVFQSGVVENVGDHVVYKEAEEQALSRVVYTTTLKKMIKKTTSTTSTAKGLC